MLSKTARALLLCGAFQLLACGADEDPSPTEEPSAPSDAGHREAGRDAQTPPPEDDVPRDGETRADSGRDASVPRDASPVSEATVAADASVVKDAALPSSDSDGSDDIFGSKVDRADSWWAADGNVHHGDQEVRLFGLNWFGLETDSHALFGPSEAKRTVADFLSQVKSLGFNALRVPLSPESINPGTPSASWANRGAIDTGREHFEELINAARDAKLYMLWDIHTCASSVGFMKKSPIDPACTNYGKAGWLKDLKTLATLAKDYAPWVVAIDLFNEPYGLSWADWKALAEEGGEVVLRENPRILTFVEGVGSEGYSGDAVFWGENLTGAMEQPPKLPASRLVFSPHVYGPSVYNQPYFGEGGFPANMPDIWDRHWGALLAKGTPVILGEFGGKYVDADKTWQDALGKYLLDRGAHSFFYWCLNPNSGDTGGLLQDDWRTVNEGKLTLLKSLTK